MHLTPLLLGSPLPLVYFWTSYLLTAVDLGLDNENDFEIIYKAIMK